jgi:4-hydroxymandelate oxidase
MTIEHLNRIPPEIAALDDYIPFAKARLSAKTWAYIHSGSADEISFKNNSTAYHKISLLNRVLKDLSKGNTRVSLLNENLKHPIILAPVAHQKLAHPEGEIASAMAAEAQDALYVLSALASTLMEDVAQRSSGPRWFQLYFQESPSDTLDLVRRAETNSFSALVVTVDAPINGLRNTIQRSGFQVPSYASAVNVERYQATPPSLSTSSDSLVFQGFMAKAPTWKDIEWLKQQCSLPIIVKGIMNPRDAEYAQKIGADAIVLSNHGGRTLDTLPSPVEVLPTARKALGDSFPIIIDSGIRRGGDIVKAIALGANAVMIGRPIMYALATAGALGVAHTIKLLRDELELTMALCGCETLADISSDCLWQNQ